MEVSQRIAVITHSRLWLWLANLSLVAWLVTVGFSAAGVVVTVAFAPLLSAPWPYQVAFVVLCGLFGLLAASEIVQLASSRHPAADEARLAGDVKTDELRSQLTSEQAAHRRADEALVGQKAKTAQLESDLSAARSALNFVPPEPVPPTVAPVAEMDAVPLDLAYLQRLFKEHTDAQATKLVQVYLGSLWRVEARVADVTEDGEKTAVYASVEVDKDTSMMVALDFPPEWHSRVMALRKGTIIRGQGTIRRVTATYVALTKCQFNVPSTPDTPKASRR